MKNRQMRDTTYCIHGFMTCDMCLGGGELLVFAIIYSFTKGEGGIYYGTQDYLARATGMSISTVKRSLTGLTEKGYVVRCSSGKREGYRATAPEGLDREAIEAEGPPNDAERVLPSSYAGEQGIDVRRLLASEEKHPKYEFHQVGSDGYVSMTAEQYKRLLKLVGSEVLTGYIRRLELLIGKQGYRTFSPYKTIKKWIYEDAAV